MTIYVCVVLSTNKRDKPDCLVVFVTELNWPGLWGTLDTLWVLGTNTQYTWFIACHLTTVNCHCRVPSAALRVRHGAAGKVFPQRGTPALWPRGIPATGVGNRDLALKPFALGQQQIAKTLKMYT